MRKIILVVFILISAQHSFAQQTVYFSKDSTQRGTKKKHRSSELNVVKIAPLTFISGYIPVYYERSITDFFSVQAGLGLTTRNYLREWANNFEIGETKTGTNTWNGQASYDENYNSLNSFNNRKASMGYFFSIQPRIYFESDGLEGSFLAISYDRANYKSLARKIETGNTGNASGEPVFTSAEFAEKEIISDISANFGNQTVYDRITLEYTVGIALRKVTGTKYAYTFDNSGNYIDGFTTLNRTTPAFTFALRIGYHF
ncbi:MAG: hypothetical protein WAT19_02175 [Ferruginibacter sp.]